MSVSVFSAAKYLGERSQWDLTHLEMQKMLYIAHLFHLGRHKTPLVRGQFEAWDYGPVHPSLYHRLKIFGSSPVKKYIFPEEGGQFSQSASHVNTYANIIEEVCDALLNAKPGKLVAITHWEKGAWARNYKAGVRGIPIPNEHIIEEYNSRVN